MGNWFGLVRMVVDVDFIRLVRMVSVLLRSRLNGRAPFVIGTWVMSCLVEMVIYLTFTCLLRLLALVCRTKAARLLGLLSTCLVQDWCAFDVDVGE